MQAALPYKEFQIGDIISNLLGAGLGLYSAEKLDHHRRSRRELMRLYLPVDEEESQVMEPQLNGQEASGDSWSQQTVWSFAPDDSDSDPEVEAANPKA